MPGIEAVRAARGGEEGGELGAAPAARKKNGVARAPLAPVVGRDVLEVVLEAVVEHDGA